MIQEKKFGAFIMTFERPEVLKITLTRIFDQTFPPAYVLVVDNSYSSKTKDFFLNCEDDKIGYHHMGSNTGPAGAAWFGLQKLSALGFEWIYWGDDNDPPRDQKVFEQLFRGVRELTENGVNLGIFGGKGGNFNKWTGRMSSLSNRELEEAPYVEVDSVPGGQDLLVNSLVVKAGVLPNEKLFFGFEEFDFCLKAKSAGFQIFTDAENWLKIRQKSGVANIDYRWRGHSFGNREYLQREFYSTRNLLEILYRHRYYFAFSFVLLKCLSKMAMGFRFGPDYGKRMFRIQFSALKAFFQQDFSQRLKPD